MLNSYQKPGWMETADYYAADCLPLAMAYVPFQKFHMMFDHEEALSKGTIFPELWKPFCGKGGACL